MKNKILDAVHIEPTGMCNLRCKYCYNSNYANYNKISKELPYKRWIEIINEAYNLGCRDYAISGGESLVYTHFFDMIEYIAAKGVDRIAVFSNAMLIDENFCKKINNIKPKIEFRISFDGYSEADMIRVGSNHLKILKALKLLRKYGFPVVVNTLLTEVSRMALMNIYEELDKIGVQKWLIDFPFRNGRALKYISQSLPPTENVDSVCIMIKRYIKEKPSFVLEVQNLFKSQMLRGEFYQFDIDSGTCSYMKEGVTIHPDGKVSICPTLSLSCGNVKKNSLRSIVIGKKRNNLLNIRLNQLNKCPDCKYWKVCGGGCRADAKSECGSIYQNDPVACFLMPVMEKRILPLLPENVRKKINKVINK